MSAVLVAGATGPIGSAIVRLLASRGHRMIVHHRASEASARRLVASLDEPRRHSVVAANLSDAGAAGALVLEARRRSAGDLAAVVNCAWPSHASVELGAPDPDGLVDRSFDGVRAHLALCRAALPSLRETNGAIVFLGGALASRLHPGLGYYSMGKAAATTATLTLALEEGVHGVRANVVAPGRVDVGDGDLAESDPRYASLDEIGRRRRALPLPTAEQVARLVGFLIGPDAGAVTGQVFGVAGGEQL